MHSDFPNCRSTVVAVLCLLIALAFISGKHVGVGVELNYTRYKGGSVD
jgi:hypothetical protein